MHGSVRCREPSACTEPERRAFSRLVRRGFASAADTLDRRIRDARCLAFCYDGDATLAGIAALKSPGERYRDDVFHRAAAPKGAADYEFELGWVFVLPSHRGNRIAAHLCRRLMAQVPTAPVFATTRPDNTAMIRVLDSLGFTHVGRPYARRDEQLALFVRSRPTHWPAPGSPR